MRMKFAQKVDQFESFPSTSCCLQKFPPNKMEKFGWLDMRGSIRDVYLFIYIWWAVGDGLAGKGFISKLRWGTSEA